MKKSPKVSVVTPTIRPNGLEDVRGSLLKQTFRDFEWLVDINWTGAVDFNAAMNRLLMRSRGEIIVSIQDHIAIPEDALEKIVKLPEHFYTFPVMIDRRTDWRVHTTGPVSYEKWEIDFGSAPRKALFAIGGFDEVLDQYWGFDNVNVGKRADMAGYEIHCVPDIVAKGEDHRQNGHEFSHLRDPVFHQQRLREIEMGEAVFNFLS